MKAKIQFLVLSVIFLFTTKVNAQIFYQDINPDIVLDSWNSKDINIDSTVSSALSYGDPGNLTIWEEFNSRIVINAFSDCEVIISNGYPAALNLDAVISSGGNLVQPNYAVLYDGSKGNWKGAVDKYLGVRVKKGADWLYGWIRLDVNSTGSAVTIKDYACNRKANSSINAGQNSNTGVDDLLGYESNLVSIYPNPFNSWTTMTISSKYVSNTTLLIYNTSGNVVKIINNISTNQIIIDRRNLSSGLYFYQLKQGNYIIVSGKLIIAD
jgi:hypothetical protein